MPCLHATIACVLRATLPLWACHTGESAQAEQFYSRSIAKIMNVSQGFHNRTDHEYVPGGESAEKTLNRTKVGPLGVVTGNPS